MASKKFESVETKNLTLPGSTGDLYYKSASGLVLPRTLAQVKSDLSIGRREVSVFYVNSNFAIPSWLSDTDLMEVVTQGGGSSAGSGGSNVATTSACTGGGSGTAGSFNRSIFNVGFLRSLGATLAIVVGQGGASAAGAISGGTGNPGNNGNATTVTVGSTVISRASGGLAGNRGSNVAATGASAVNAPTSVGTGTGGIYGANGVGSSSSGSTGTNGNTSGTESAGSGGSGGGVSTGNLASSGNNGGFGAISARAVNEAVTPIAGNAVAQFVPGSSPQIPYPGNGGGSSSGVTSGVSLKGGDGVNGGSGGGSGAGRGGSGLSGKGGNGFCYLILNGTASPAKVTEHVIPGGRLTLSATQSNPVSDITGATTLYYLPHIHNQIQLFDNADWITHQFNNVSIALTGKAIGVYDVFAFSNGNVVTLELQGWTNNTTRAIAIEQRNGVWVKVGDNTRRLLGTIYVPTIGTCDCSSKKIFVSNAYNRLTKYIGFKETTPSWNAAAAATTWEPWGNRPGAITAGLANRIEIINCLHLDSTLVNFSPQMNPPSGTGCGAALAVDQITTPTSSGLYITLNASVPYNVLYCVNLGAGYHFIQAMQISYFTVNGLFGSNNASGFDGNFNY